MQIYFYCAISLHGSDNYPVALRVKGSNWKGCFHMPRRLLFNWLLLKEMGKGY